MNLGVVLGSGETGLILVAMVYIVLRASGKYFGIFFSSRVHRDGPNVRYWLGASLMAQAGAALALVDAVKGPDSQLGEIGDQLHLVILGTVAVFEIAGPILIQTAVLRSGEVPLSHAIRHSTTTPKEALVTMMRRVLTAFGFDPRRGRSASELTVEQVVRKGAQAIRCDATFDEVIDHIEHSRDNTYPVVDKSNILVGLIRYPDLRDALFDPKLAALVRAEDLAAPYGQLLYLDDPVAKAWSQIRRGQDDCIPVVDRGDGPQLVGLVRRRDLIGLFANPGRRAKKPASH